MSQFRAKCLPVLLFILLSNALYAQTSTISNPNSERENNPYSKYGIGELWNGNSTALKGMGNITSAYADPYQVNNDNPASYATLALTTFDVGLTGTSRRIVAGNGDAYNTGTASIGYLSMGIPLNKHGGLSFGFKPVSRAYYALVDTINTAMGQTMRSYAGDGGLTYAYLGGAYKYKGFSIGVNVGYMFGTFNNLTTVTSIDTAAIYVAYEAEFPRTTRVGGIYWKAGLMYEHPLADSDYMFRIGGTFALSQNLNEKMNYYQVSTYNFGDTIVNDTTYRADALKGKLKMPTTFSIGALLSRTDKWNVGVDYSMTSWSTYNSSPNTDMNIGIASSAYKLSAGGEYTPNINELNNYFSRVTYRLGAYYGTDYIKLAGTTLPVYGVTFGGSFPFKRTARTHSHVNASFDIGRLGTTSNNQLKETYVRFGIGINFNDKWFIPRKYD